MPFGVLEVYPQTKRIVVEGTLPVLVSDMLGDLPGGGIQGRQDEGGGVGWWERASIVVIIALGHGEVLCALPPVASVDAGPDGSHEKEWFRIEIANAMKAAAFSYPVCSWLLR